MPAVRSDGGTGLRYFGGRCTSLTNVPVAGFFPVGLLQRSADCFLLDYERLTTYFSELIPWLV